MKIMSMRTGEVASVVLKVLAGSVLLLAAVTAPNAARALLPLLDTRRIKREQLESAIRRLKNRRLVRFETKAGKSALVITDEGRKYHRYLELKNLNIEIPRHWDKKWTIILFDIPERFKTGRDALRHQLKRLGCFQFHKSVFVHPAPCEDEIDFITELFGIRSFVTVFRTSSLGNHEQYAYRHFWS